MIADMVPLLKERGYQVDVLVFNGKNTPFKEQLQKKNIRVFELGKGGSVYNPLFILKLIPFLSRYEIIHTHNTACQYFVALAKFISCIDTKFVTTEHSTCNRRRAYSIFRILDKLMYRQYDRIVSISEIASEKLIDYLGDSTGISVIPNGININLFSGSNPIDREELGIASNGYMITMVAGFRHEKDQDTLIRSMVLLPRNYYLCLVGDGIRRLICEKLAKELGVMNRVIFTGIRSDIPRILQASDIVVMSSHWEGLSLSSIEGMSVNKPFIASDVNGLHEITEGAGVLFPKGDVELLAMEIERLMGDSGYYQTIAIQCKKRASVYDIRKTVENYEGLYKKMIRKFSC